MVFHTRCATGNSSAIVRFPSPFGEAAEKVINRELRE